MIVQTEIFKYLTTAVAGGWVVCVWGGGHNCYKHGKWPEDDSFAKYHL
jgi:hypothetical protein